MAAKGVQQLAEALATQAIAAVRDTFSMPEDDHSLIGEIRDRAVRDHGLVRNKSEIVRAALMVLAALPPDEQLTALQAADQLKPGRR